MFFMRIHGISDGEIRGQTMPSSTLSPRAGFKSRSRHYNAATDAASMRLSRPNPIGDSGPAINPATIETKPWRSCRRWWNSGVAGLASESESCRCGGRRHSPLA